MKKNERGNVDLDAQMLGGCSAFVMSSLITYGLGIWPFFVFVPLYLAKNLVLATGLATAQMAIFTLVVARKAALAGGFGAFSGCCALGVFYFLTIGRTVPIEAIAAQQYLEYEPYLGWTVPLSWLAMTAFLVALRSAKFKKRVPRV